MSIATSTGPLGEAGGALLPSLAATAKRMCAAFIVWRIERSALATLRSMSDKELNDIGLARSEIDSAVQIRLPQDRAPAREY